MLRVMQAIAGAANRLNELDRKGIIDLAPKAADIDIDDVRSQSLGVIPKVGNDHLARDQAVNVSHHVFEQGIFLRGQIKGLFPAPRIMRGWINPKIRDREAPTLALGFTAKERTQPCP